MSQASVMVESGAAEDTLSVARVQQPPQMGRSASSRPSSRPRPRRKARSLWSRTLPIIVFFLIWEVVSRINAQTAWMNPVFFPAPSTIARTGWQLWQDGTLWPSLVASTIRIVFGFAVGTVLAIGLSTVVNRFRVVEHWIAPILNLVGPIPALALLPLFIIWFGIGELPKVILIAWTTLIPVYVYTLDGLKSVNPVLLRSAMSLGANQRKIFLKVILPSAIPNVLAGAQVSLGLSFSSLIVAEMMGASDGLGYIIVNARNYFEVSNMFVAVVLIGLEYSLFSFGLRLVEKRVMAWRKGGFDEAVET